MLHTAVILMCTILTSPGLLCSPRLDLHTSQRLMTVHLACLQVNLYKVVG